MKEEGFRVAVIDLGTNAIRLQIARVLPGRRHELVAEEREAVRLGEGLFTTGELSREAMARTADAIARFARLAREAGVHRLRAVATAAVREARNRAEFVRRVAEETGVALEVISGAEEARLAALGVMTDRGLRGHDHLLVDLGGGSTELTLVKAGQAERCWSLEIGAVRLSELFLGRSDPPSRRDLERLRLYARQAFEKVDRKAWSRGIDLVGSAGTIGALAELLRRREKRPTRRGRIERKALEALFDELAALPLAERRALPGMDERRADIVVAGAAIVLELLRHAGAREVIPTRRGLRDGLVVDLVARVGLPAGFPRSDAHLVDEGLRAFLRRCGADESHADRVTAHALTIFDGLSRVHGLDGTARAVLRGAAMLHDVGRFVAYSGHHKHARYLIAGAELPGYSDTERELVAMVARYHRKAAPKRGHRRFRELSRAEQEEVAKLSAILRVADALDRGRRSLIRDVEVRVSDRAVRLVVRHDGEAELERWAVEEKAAPVFEDALGVRLRLDLRVAHPGKLLVAA